ncbi:MAG: hypothetical protein D6814_04410, partial [Calditrichaeota bacterium]
ATGYGSVVQPTNLALHFWAGVGAWSHALGTSIPPLRAGKKRAMVLIPLIVLALMLDTVLYRDWWGPPFAILLYLLALVGSGVLGIEFVLAGLMGFPGCESTAIANLLHHGATPKIESCALWDPLIAGSSEHSGREPQRNLTKGVENRSKRHLWPG